MERNQTIDLLKLTLAFMVVGLHSSFLADISTLLGYLTSQGIFRIAVPMFLLINGFYFYKVLDRHQHLFWFKRVFVLYCSWMLFYAYSWFRVPEFSFATFCDLATKMVLGHHHLWYLSGMLGAALFLIIGRRMSDPLLMCSVMLTFSVGCFIQYAGNYQYFQGMHWNTLSNLDWVHRNMLLFSYPFFCLGYLINKHELHRKISLPTAGIGATAGLVLLIVEAWNNAIQPTADARFDNLLSLAIVCPLLFITLLHLPKGGTGKQIALYSSAIYFIHPFIISVLLFFTSLHATMLTIATIAASFIAAYCIILLNQRFKVLL